ncbi:MAG: restriction endonuclease subunit S [Anaerolineaceae bacterium]|nr:restriction endonuclease subunit S [Anaerolineaceae bacterium]
MCKTIKRYHLGEIAEIRTGFTFRERVEEVSAGGNAHVAQIKDVRGAWEATNTPRLQAHQLPLINWQGKDKAFALPGAVLLPARGAKGGYFRASCLVSGQESALPVVVSSQFLVITAREGVLPEFLCWSLNRPAMQYWLSEGAGGQGTSLVMLTTKVAKALELEIPGIPIQQKILHLNELWEKEQQLTQALLNNRESMLQGMFQQLLMEKSS